MSSFDDWVMDHYEEMWEKDDGDRDQERKNGSYVCVDRGDTCP